MARQFNNSLTKADFEEVLTALADICPRVVLRYDPDYVAVNNGLFNRPKQALEPFTPERVLIHKTNIDEIVNPSVVQITMPDQRVWEFNAWLVDLFCMDENDPDQVAEAKRMAHFVKQCMAACLRPGTDWDKVALFYAEQGSNGKGTIVSIIENILGEGASLSIPLDKFAEDAYIEKTPGIMAVLTHENPVNAFAKDVSRWKAFTTGDKFRVNRKYKSAIELIVQCFQVQCFNSKFRTPDTSDSFYRRLMVMPFLKTFKGAAERKYIKKDYLRRKDVLERIQWELLRMDFDTFDIPETVLRATEELQRDNDPVQTFWSEISSELAWDVIPAKFIFDLFDAWAIRNKMGVKMGRNTFYERLQQTLRGDGCWAYQEGKVRIGRHLDAAEPLVSRYQLRDWDGLDLPADSQGGWGARARAVLPQLATNVVRRLP